MWNYLGKQGRVRDEDSIIKDLYSNVITKFEGLFGKVFKAIKTLMSEGCHSEVDDSLLCIEDDSDKYISRVG
jgi:hypothetical protein